MGLGGMLGMGMGLGGGLQGPAMGNGMGGGLGLVREPGRDAAAEEGGVGDGVEHGDEGV